jgi:hypothetical protein
VTGAGSALDALKQAGRVAAAVLLPLAAVNAGGDPPLWERIPPEWASTYDATMTGWVLLALTCAAPHLVVAAQRVYCRRAP